MKDFFGSLFAYACINIERKQYYQAMRETSHQNLLPYVAASQAYFAQEFTSDTPRASFSGSVTAQNVTITYGITWSGNNEGGTAAVDVTRHAPDACPVFPDSLEENQALVVNLLHNAMAEVPFILAENESSEDEDYYIESFGMRLAIVKPEFDDAEDEKDWQETIADFVFPISLDKSFPTPAYSFEPLGYSRKEIPFAMGAVAFRGLTGDTSPEGFPEFWAYASRISFNSLGEEAEAFLESQFG